MDKYVGTVRRMMRNALPRRRFASRVLLGGVILILLVGGIAAGITIAASRPVIREITVAEDSETIYSSDELAQTAGLSVGMPLYAKTRREITAAILAAYPDLQTVNTKKTANNGTITLKIEEKQPYFYIVTGSDIWLADASLTLLRRVSNEDEIKGLIRLAISDDVFSATGEPLNFGDDTAYYQSYINTVLSGALKTYVTGISLERRYDLKLLLDDRIVLHWGTSDRTSEKTALCLEMLRDSMFETGKFATVDVSDPARAVARPLYSAEGIWQAFSD